MYFFFGSLGAPTESGISGATSQLGRGRGLSAGKRCHRVGYLPTRCPGFSSGKYQSWPEASSNWLRAGVKAVRKLLFRSEMDHCVPRGGRNPLRARLLM